MEYGAVESGKALHGAGKDTAVAMQWHDTVAAERAVTEARAAGLLL